MYVVELKSRMGKLVAVVASIAVFVMPAATMPFHCMLRAPSGETHPCPMMGRSSSADEEQVSLAHFDHSCCQVSTAKPESLTVPQSSSGKRILAPPTTNAVLADLPAAPLLHELRESAVPSLGGPPQAVLCTFLI